MKNQQIVPFNFFLSVFCFSTANSTKLTYVLSLTKTGSLPICCLSSFQASFLLRKGWR